MTRPGFLDTESRQELTRLARCGSVSHAVARQANALVLLDAGVSCQTTAYVMLLDDDTIRNWCDQWRADGVQALANFVSQDVTISDSVLAQMEPHTLSADALPHAPEALFTPYDSLLGHPRPSEAVTHPHQKSMLPMTRMRTAMLAMLGLLIVATTGVAVVWLLPNQTITLLALWILISCPFGVLIGHCVLGEEIQDPAALELTCHQRRT